MSSHHIVRDAQEPALLLADLNGWQWAHLGALLEWSPVVAATEATLPTALAWGIKIDLLVGHPAHQQALAAQVAHQQPINLYFSEDKQALAALQYLLAKGHEAVHVCTALAPGPTPDIAWQQAAQRCKLVFFGPDWKGYFISQTFKKWVPAGAVFYVPPAHALQAAEGLAHQGEGFWQSTAAGHVCLVPAEGSTCWVMEALG